MPITECRANAWGQAIMTNLANISEPTTAYRQSDEPAAAATIPMGIAIKDAAEDQSRSQRPGDHEEPQHLLDSVLFLVIMLIAGGLLRLVFCLLGPLQGIESAELEGVAQLGRQAVEMKPTNAYPLFGLIGHGVSSVGLPGWVLIALGSLISLAAVPASFVIGQALTGRRVAGVLSAAIVALHPAVLTASNMLAPQALAVGLVTIGMALVCLIHKKGTGYGISGGLCLGLAGLASPLCWLVGLFAVPLAGRFSAHRGAAKSLACVGLVALFALGPVLAFRLAFFGAGTDGLLPEFSAVGIHNEQFAHANRLLVTMTDPSLSELGQALHLPLGDAGRLTVSEVGLTGATDRSDIVADLLADGWLLMNAGLAGLAAVSAGVMLWRRRVWEALLLAGPLLAIAFTTLPPSEALRLPLIPLVGVLAMGMIASRPIPLISEEEREAKRQARLARRLEKEQARQQRALEKHHDNLHAFDQPKRRAMSSKAKASEETPSEESAELLSMLDEEQAPALSRPI